MVIPITRLRTLAPGHRSTGRSRCSTIVVVFGSPARSGRNSGRSYRISPTTRRSGSRARSSQISHGIRSRPNRPAHRRPTRCDRSSICPAGSTFAASIQPRRSTPTATRLSR
uniref:Uncharacterized protein n=1 Tax=uncultured marine virus TaxID=186617 RepID=A0A0F7L7B1_9VIRU|nr:hypothetical protein [uncultured marine virus]